MKIAEHRKARGQAIDVVPKRSHAFFKDNIQNRINTKSSKIIYIGGYTDDKGLIYLQCTDCGNFFARSTKILRPSGKKSIQCDCCMETLSNIKEKEHKEKIALNEMIRIQKSKARMIQKKMEYVESHSRVCQRCGASFTGTPKMKYCSKECSRRQQNANQEHLRRIRINNNYHDNISIEVLADKDKNKCWLCGKAVDWNDYYHNKNGVFIAGENYPSIDHVVALSNGGTHTWDNVRLAHRKCNTKKRNNVFGERKGQLILFC